LRRSAPNGGLFLGEPQVPQAEKGGKLVGNIRGKGLQEERFYKKEGEEIKERVGAKNIHVFLSLF